MYDEIEKIIEKIDVRLILLQETKQPVPRDLDMLIKLSIAYEQQKNNWNELKEQVEKAKQQSKFQNDAYRFTAYQWILKQMKKLEENNEKN